MLSENLTCSRKTNIMMGDDGRPYVTDIGLKYRLSKVLNHGAWKIPSGWMFKAPEELVFEYDPVSFLPTRAMDVYAFARTVYVVSATNPYGPVCLPLLAIIDRF